ncbi:MAG TPA: TIM barrel protein [bacterium]|nr:TIM barrel protein [bacterium]
MKLGCGTASFHRKFFSGEMDIFDWMAVCARDLKVSGIEISDRHLQSADEDYVCKVKRVAVDLGLTISALTVSTDFGIADDAARDKQLEDGEFAAQLAAALGAPILRFSAGRPEENKEAQWDEMVRCVQIMCELAERDGIVMAVCNEADEDFIQTYEDIDRLMTDVGSEWLRLGLNADAFGSDAEGLTKSMFYTVHVSVSGNSRGFDCPAFIRAAAGLNYRGFVCHRGEGAEDEAAAAARGVETLRALIAG